MRTQKQIDRIAELEKIQAANVANGNLPLLTRAEKEELAELRKVAA